MKKILFSLALVVLSSTCFGRVICDTTCHAPEDEFRNFAVVSPVGFFDAHKQSLKTLVAARDTRPRRAVRWWYAAACAGIIAIYPVGRMIYRAIYEPVPVYGATNDADEWSEFANADIFLEIK